MHQNEIGTLIVDCAVGLHQAVGPGLLESVYEVTLARALEKRGLRVERQASVPIAVEGERFDEGFRADMIVEGKVIVELKSVEKVSPAHKKQFLTYLAPDRNETGLPAELWRGAHEGWNYTDDQWISRPRPPCLRVSVRE